MVALKPWKQPSTRLRVHVSKTCSCLSSGQNTRSKLKDLVPTTIFYLELWSPWTMHSLLLPSVSSLPTRGLTLTATATEQASYVKKLIRIQDLQFLSMKVTNNHHEVYWLGDRPISRKKVLTLSAKSGKKPSGLGPVGSCKSASLSAAAPVARERD